MANGGRDVGGKERAADNGSLSGDNRLHGRLAGGPVMAPSAEEWLDAMMRAVHVERA